MAKWFQKAIRAKPPYTLGGWKKTKGASSRRRAALGSRPKSWSLKKRRLSAGRALLALANVTRDGATKKRAKVDAAYFFRKLK